MDLNKIQPIIEAYKICSICKMNKSITDFTITSRSPYRTYFACKLCINIRAKQRGYDKKYRQSSQYSDVLKKSYQKHKADRLQANISRAIRREKVDIVFKLKNRYRSSISTNLRRFLKKKSYTTTHLLGCSIEDLKQHLESQFTEGMSWENYGKNGWHIDHIKPCASFDLTDLEQQRICFHYTNLQPLWAKDNLEKSSLHEGKRYKHPKNSAIFQGL